MNPRVSITSTVKVSRRRIRDSNGIPPTQKRKPLVAWFDGIEEQQMPSNPIVFLKEKEEKKIVQSQFNSSQTYSYSWSNMNQKFRQKLSKKTKYI